jgi:integrase
VDIVDIVSFFRKVSTKPDQTQTGGLSAECQQKLDEIDLHFHDLRHEAGSRKLESGWPLHAVSVWLGQASLIL